MTDARWTQGGRKVGNTTQEKKTIKYQYSGRISASENPWRNLPFKRPEASWRVCPASDESRLGWWPLCPQVDRNETRSTPETHFHYYYPHYFLLFIYLFGIIIIIIIFNHHF